MNVQIPLNNIEELTEVFLAANATALPEEVDEAIKTGIENGSIIPEGAKGKEKYTIKYNPKISEFTGEFYTKIPEIGLGDTSTTVGIYSKENDNKINNNYLKPTQLADIEGNLLLPGSAGTAKYQRTEVDEGAVRAIMRPALQAKAAGLLSTYFSDNASANGILRKLGFGTDYPLKKFNETYKGETAQVNALVQKMEEEEWKNISTKSDLKKIGDKYYIMDSESYQMFNKPSKKSGSGTTGTQKNQADLNADALWIINNGGVFRGKGGLILNVDSNGKATVTKVGGDLSEEEVLMFKNRTPKQMANMMGATLR